MNRILDKLVDTILAVFKGRTRINKSIASFLDQGRTKMYVFSILLLVPFLVFSFYLYRNVQNQIWAIVPILVFTVVRLVIYINDRINFRLQNNRAYRKSELKGIHLDLNERVFKKIYFYLTKYGYIDENRTSFQDFSNVLAEDFKENESVIHFNMNL